MKRIASSALGILGVLLCVKPSLSDDGAVSALVDWEWFIPWSDQTERFASRQRVRMGGTYRRSQAWRYFAFYIRNRSRNTLDEEFATSENIFNFQARRVW